jgi:hypothetical protein
MLINSPFAGAMGAFRELSTHRTEIQTEADDTHFRTAIEGDGPKGMGRGNQSE